MNSPWKIAKLGEVIRQRKEFITIDDLKEYKRCRVQLHAKGIVLRDFIEGARIKTKQQQLCQAGELLVAEIDAKVGGYGIVPEDLAGAIVSSHYFLFEIDEARLNRRFLDYFIRTPYFYVQVLARGSTNYAAIRPHHVLEYEIPLPSLSEQQRIVARIEELAAKIEEARGLRQQAKQGVDVVLSLCINIICYESGHSLVPFGEVLTEAKNGIYKPSVFWGRGIACIRMYNINGPSLNINNLQLLDVTDEEFETYGCHDGDLIFNRVNSRELVGKTGLVTRDYPDCTFESKNMRLRVDRSKVLSAYAAIILNSNHTRSYYLEVLKQQCGMATLNQTHVKSIPFSLPPIKEQGRIVAYLDDLQAKINALKSLQKQTTAELDALLPSILDKAFKGEL